MTSSKLNDLREREKELRCIYRVHEAVSNESKPLRDVLKKAVDTIPDGWQYPGLCMAKLELDEFTVTTNHFFETNIHQSAEIVVDEEVLGKITVYYSKNPCDSVNCFIPEEQHLLNMIADQVSQTIFNRRLRSTVECFQNGQAPSPDKLVSQHSSKDQHWQWRLKMIQRAFEQMDLTLYGVEAVYIIGSVKEAKAGPKSDIDLIIHFHGDVRQKELLNTWVAAWGRALAFHNYDRTGYMLEEGIIDAHYVTTDEIEKKSSSYAAMIGSMHNSARLIKKRT